MAAVLAAVFLVETGVFALLPILPLYLRERGISYSLAGLIVGANLAAQFVFQYPAGRLSDRVGRRPVMVGGLLLAAAGTAALVLPVPPTVLILIRFLQGTGTATFLPGAAAALSDAVPAQKRGAAYGLFTAAAVSGLTVGPAVGGVLAVFGRIAVFETMAVILVLDAVVVGLLLAGRRPVRIEAEREGPKPRIARSALWAVGLIWLGGGFLFGMYDLIWSLFMRSFGATDWMIGASFSLFGLPLVLVSPFAGQVADRVDRRWLAVAGLAVAGALAPVYPLLHSFWPVVLVGVVEATALAFADPASMAFLMDATPESQRGRAQGALGAMQFASQAVGAGIAGPLFAAGVALPFLTGSAVCLAAVLASIPLFRLAARNMPARARTAVPAEPL